MRTSTLESRGRGISLLRNHDIVFPLHCSTGVTRIMLGAVGVWGLKLNVLLIVSIIVVIIWLSILLERIKSYIERVFSRIGIILVRLTSNYLLVSWTIICTENDRPFQTDDTWLRPTLTETLFNRNCNSKYLHRNFYRSKWALAFLCFSSFFILFLFLATCARLSWPHSQLLSPR